MGKFRHSWLHDDGHVDMEAVYIAASGMRVVELTKSEAHEVAYRVVVHSSGDAGMVAERLGISVRMVAPYYARARKRARESGIFLPTVADSLHGRYDNELG